MSPRFGFTQFEYPWVLGPGDGRLVLREGSGGPPAQIIVLRTLGAPERRRGARLPGGGRRARQVPAGEPSPTPVATTRATVIDAAALADSDTQGPMAASDPLEVATAALAALNRVIHAHRIATADPYVNPLKLDDAIVVRVGHGNGEEVADGRWTEALELPHSAIERRVRRPTSALRPQERLAALLGGRDEALDCEELALRARLDLDSERISAAALGVRLAIDTALVELPERHDLTERIQELRELRRSLSEPPQVRHALERLEAVLRARTARGLS